MAQDDYYYEIQLTNKQLVFYFMAGATGLILSFLAGVMVGRGVDASAGEVQAARIQEDRIIAEEPLAVGSPSPSFSYAERLEGDKPVEIVEQAPKPAATTAPAPPTTAAPAPRATPTPATPAPARVADVAPPRAAPESGGVFTIQVGAFKDKASAESVSSRLKTKGYQAYVVSPDAPDGLFNVRVGRYATRPEAEKIQVRLRDEEKYKPFIVKP